MCLYFGGNLKSWSSRKQKSVARSSTEAEYHSLAQACTEITWLQSLFTEIGVKYDLPSIIWCDNSGVWELASNPVFHSITKHIEIDVHFIRGKVLNNSVEVRYIPSGEQTGDILTKSLSIPAFNYLKDKLTVRYSRGMLK